MRVTLTQLNGVNIAPVNLNVVNGSVIFNFPVNSGSVQPWSVDLSSNIGTPVTNLFGPGNLATGHDVEIDNTMTATAVAGSQAFNNKTEFQIIVETVVIPEPSSGLLMLGALLFLPLSGPRRQRNSTERNSPRVPRSRSQPSEPLQFPRRPLRRITRSAAAPARSSSGPAAAWSRRAAGRRNTTARGRRDWLSAEGSDSCRLPCISGNMQFSFMLIGSSYGLGVMRLGPQTGPCPGKGRQFQSSFASVQQIRRRLARYLPQNFRRKAPIDGAEEPEFYVNARSCFS